MKRKLRNELRVGLMLFALYGVFYQFFDIPHFVLGGLIGASVCLMLIGGLGESQYNALKSLKRSIKGIRK